MAENEGYVETINEFVINSFPFEYVVPTYSKGKLVNDQKNAKGVVMPIQFQMKKLFEQNDVLLNTLNFIKSLKESSKIEYIQISGAGALIKVHFILGLLVCDNLALNSVLNFQVLISVGFVD